MASDAKLVSETTERRTLALAFFDHLETQASLATTTAGLIVAANAILLGGFVVFAEKTSIRQEWTSHPFAISFGLAGLFLLLGLLISLYAVVPNCEPIESTGKTNVFFFGSVAGATSGEEYVQTFNGTALVDLDENVLLEIWAKSWWLRRMFRLIRSSIILNRDRGRLCTFDRRPVAFPGLTTSRPPVAT